nr:MAG TPA: hypothetical protein [Caudoviricetes sp.]
MLGNRLQPTAKLVRACGRQPHPYGGMGGAIYFGEFGTLTLAIP